MGQENSHEMISEDTPPETLSSRSLNAVAEYIRDGTARQIVVLTGAGLSTAAGIPDFRSPETGLYANLARLDLPSAESVFDISYFRYNPDPFYVLAKELYPGRFYPTIAHCFIALLEQKSLLRMLFTQNIDCLERRAGVSDYKIVEAHGSFATQRCIECASEYPDDLMKEAVASGSVPHCLVPQCNGLVKPDIVFFGEALPENFHRNRGVPGMADLMIIMGTSLSVHPFASLPQSAAEGVPRLLFNKERVGDLGSRPDDVVVLGECDESVRKLADALGWREELEALWTDVTEEPKREEAAREEELKKGMSKDELLEAEIEKLTSEVDQSLKLSKDHEERVTKQLEKPQSKSAGVSDVPLKTATEVQTESKDSSEPASSAAAQSQAKATPKETSPLHGENVDKEKEEPTLQPNVNTQAIPDSDSDSTLPHNRPTQEADPKI